MNRILKLLYVLFIFSILIGCKKDDKIYDSDYISPVSLHLVYGELGKSVIYTAPPVVKMTNVSEQLVSTFIADELGKVVLEGLLPGKYTMNVTARLSKEEMAIVTGKPDAAAGSLGGSMTNLKLSLGTKYQFEDLKLMISSSNPIIFKELYYAGSKTPTGMSYRNDGFYTIYNNSIDDISLEDYYIASMEFFGGFGIGPLWPGEVVGDYKHIYAAAIWKISAGETKDILKSGEEAVIAIMAAPHNKTQELNLTSPVDLSSVHYEAYNTDPQNNYADFNAKNMELMFWPSYSYLWRISVFGQGMALIKATRDEIKAFEEVMLPESFRDPFENDDYWLCKKVPNKFVVDAVDLLQNKTTTEAKRFSPLLDAGGATVESTYDGKSVIRKVQEINGDLVIYQDTNNSTDDFVINPTPLK